MWNKIFIGWGVIFGLTYLTGWWLSSENINAMYETCKKNRSDAYCSCKRQVMNRKVNRVRYVYAMRSEGYRIVSFSTQKCS